MRLHQKISLPVNRPEIARLNAAVGNLETINIEEQLLKFNQQFECAPDTTGDIYF